MPFRLRRLIFFNRTVQTHHLAAIKLETVYSNLESNIGYIWKRDELIQYGNVVHNAELIEFVFYRHTDTALKATIDEGFCLEAQSGKVYRTQNIRQPKPKPISLPKTVY